MMMLFRISVQWRVEPYVRDLKQIDAAAEKRRSHSNLHSIKSEWCQGTSEFTWLESF